MQNSSLTAEFDRRLVRLRRPAVILSFALVPLACTQKHAVRPTPPSVPSDTVGEASREHQAVVFTKPPEILNKGEIVRAMLHNYPAAARDRGIGGTVYLRVFVDEHGIEHDLQISRSSGNDLLDDAARKIVAIYRFSPALNHDKPVAAWITVPVTFNVQREDP